MGAITATLLFPIATVAGAAVGLVVAAPPSLVLAGAITALTARRHRPLRDLRQFHRDMWSILLVGVGSLDLIAVLVACALVTEVPWRLATVALVALTAVLVMLLRPAARRIVVAYAVASGWSLLDWLPVEKVGVSSRPSWVGNCRARQPASRALCRVWRVE
jgi:hypothetical protein